MPPTLKSKVMDSQFHIINKNKKTSDQILVSEQDLKKDGVEKTQSRVETFSPPTKWWKSTIGDLSRKESIAKLARSRDGHDKSTRL